MQSFICEKILTPEFGHLIDSAWALIGHERATAGGLPYGMFSPETTARLPDLGDRIRHFADMGKETAKNHCEVF
jgi:hypothetical protein